MLLQYLQYFLPILFIALGWHIQRSQDARWASSKKMGKVLILLGIITLIGRLALDYIK